MVIDWRAALIFAAFIALAVRLTCRRGGRSMPPSIPGLPFLGNTLQFLTLSHLQLDEWKNQYGPIFTLNGWGSSTVVIGNASIASDILDKMSATTSSRPNWILFGLMSKGLFFISMEYGERWRRHRRGAYEAIRSHDHFILVQEHEALLLVRDLASGRLKDDLVANLRRLSASIVWRTIYGGPYIKSLADKNVMEMFDLARNTSKAAAPGGSIVDIFPFLLCLPTSLAPFKQYANKFFARSSAFLLRITDEAIKRKVVSDGSTKLNFCTQLNDQKEKQNLSDEDIAWNSGSMFLAGATTTASALHCFVLAMVLHPDVARKAREEIDMQVGDQPPTFADRNRLPYVKGIVKEVLRWRPVAPLAQHVATEDVVYQGYTIPKGTNVMANLWSISHDPGLFDHPDEFRPERFVELEDSPNWRPNVRYDDLAFGYGRRLCIGQEIAMNSLFITIATLLWAFEFHKAVDEHGNEITPDAMGFILGGVSITPKPFPCKLVLRSENVLRCVSERL